MPAIPVVWSIAGSDPSGGAGSQADQRILNALGVHPCSVVTAVTAQSLTHFAQSQPVSAALVRSQLDELSAEPMPRPRAIKIGMLGSSANAREVVSVLERTTAFVVLDPVLRSSSGGTLADDDTLAAIRMLLKWVDLVTPNVPEAAALLAEPLESSGDLPAAAARLRELGAKQVLIKGGHLRGDLVHDYYLGPDGGYWLTSPRVYVEAAVRGGNAAQQGQGGNAAQQGQGGNAAQQGDAARGSGVRGTGCTLASAIAGYVAIGHSLRESLVLAKARVGHGLRSAVRPCTGAALLGDLSGELDSSDMPWVRGDLAPTTQRPEVPSCGELPLGFYPIVDRFSWVKRCLDLGVNTIQLRVKDLVGAELSAEIAAASDYARHCGARLFINDFWQLALEHRAYGVHLGQEDLAAADIEAIAKSGLRLGISTHSYEEACRAHALRPSYIALGPIFATTSKPMAFSPQGMARLREWSRLFPYPLVAIGGLKLEHIGAAIAAGASGVACISAITKAADPDTQIKAWLAAAGRSPRQVQAI